MNHFSTNLAICCIVLASSVALGQTRIEYNSSPGNPHLILKEEGDDYSRLYFQNMNTTLGEYWSLSGKIGITDADSRLHFYYNGPTSSGYVMGLSGERFVGIGTLNPEARLTIKQDSDNSEMGIRLIDASGNNAGRLWMDGSEFHIKRGSSGNNGFAILQGKRIGVFTNTPETMFDIHDSGNGSDNLFLVRTATGPFGSGPDEKLLEVRHNGVFVSNLGVNEEAPVDRVDIAASSGQNGLRVKIGPATALRVFSNNGTTIGANVTPPTNGLYVRQQVHIGTTSGTDRLHVNADVGENALRVQVNGATKLRVLSNGGTSIGTNNTSPPSNGLYVDGNVVVGETSQILMSNSSGTQTIRLDSDYGGHGRIITDELQITGGSDLAEHFMINTTAYVEEGTLVSIHPDYPGQLMITQNAYDRKVAGVVSGAGGIESGLIMGQKGSIADGDYPIALSGRVYVKAEARQHPIRPGDLLTSSTLPGFVQKASNRRKAPGAIVGKALTTLENGIGHVLMLISLQ